MPGPYKDCPGFPHLVRVCMRADTGKDFLFYDFSCDVNNCTQAIINATFSLVKYC